MSELSEMELDVRDFLNSIFNRPPLPPFSFYIDLSQGNADNSNKFLQNFVMQGAYRLYDKQLHELTPEQLNTLRQYLQSIGYDAQYDVISTSKVVKVYYENGQPYLRKLREKRYNITFRPADQSINTYNTHTSTYFINQ